MRLPKDYLKIKNYIFKHKFYGKVSPKFVFNNIQSGGFIFENIDMNEEIDLHESKNTEEDYIKSTLNKQPIM